jgi:excisionase family DNA binding protein
MTVKEAAEALGVSRSTIYRRFHGGTRKGLKGKQRRPHTRIVIYKYAVRNLDPKTKPLPLFPGRVRTHKL